MFKNVRMRWRALPVLDAAIPRGPREMPIANPRWRLIFESVFVSNYHAARQSFVCLMNAVTLTGYRERAKVGKAPKECPLCIWSRHRLRVE